MNSLDKVIEYLHYHQGASRHELMDALHLGIKDTQMKVLLSEGVADGYIRVEGKARATRYFITITANIIYVLSRAIKNPYFATALLPQTTLYRLLRTIRNTLKYITINYRLITFFLIKYYR